MKQAVEIHVHVVVWSWFAIIQLDSIHSDPLHHVSSPFINQEGGVRALSSH